MTPISHALPADPPPPRTNAVREGGSERSLEVVSELGSSEGFTVVAF
jgi:hypothetical protein